MENHLIMRVKKDGSRPWTNEEMDFAFDCLAAGMSASITAMAMTDKGLRSDCAPVTRNMIVGVWNRNTERKIECQKISKGEVIFRKTREYNKGPIPPRKPKEQVIPDDGITIVELTNRSCRFPYGDPLKGIRYCGHPIDLTKSKSYCTMHYSVCYKRTGTDA